MTGTNERFIPRRRGYLTVLRGMLVLSVVMLLWGCSGSEASHRRGHTEPGWPDTLRVATLYSPTSYFIYRGEKMGYDYDLLEELVNDKGMTLDLRIANTLAQAVAMLDSGTVDLIAYEVPITSQYRGRVIPAGTENITTQVLVQPADPDDGELITDVTELVGREVYVEADSKYQTRLEHLNRELGGGIIIHPVSRDTLITEDLIRMVSNGEAPLTVVDSDIAALNKGYYGHLDTGLELSFAQRSAWGVSPEMPWLADSIDSWMSHGRPLENQARLLKRYFEQSRGNIVPDDAAFPGGRISKYDDLFRKYAAEIGWDWRLLAAQSYTESRFKPNATSWAGARGLMQIMPSTGRAYGLYGSRMYDPEASIATAVKILGDLDKRLESRIPDRDERIKFVLASYNAGAGHVYDAVSLAKKYGMKADRWDNNVEKAILMKMNPKYYRDPVVKYGYSRGRETYDYVRRIFDYYDRAVAAGVPS